MAVHSLSSRRRADLAAAQPRRTVTALQAVVLLSCVLAGVALTWVLAVLHSRLDLLALAVALVAVYGATRAVAPPPAPVVLETTAAAECAGRILDLRARGTISTDEAERLLAAVAGPVREHQLR